jgi:nitrate/nitrite transporter NarK
MQDVLGYSALEVALHLLPQAIAGILVNVVAAMILHKVSNKLLAGIGAIAYFFAAILLALMKESNAYWPFIFPSLILSVIGADLQFNVAIVSSPAQNWTLTDDADVRNVFFASKAAISCRRHLQHG